MKFLVPLPGVIRYPPERYRSNADRWDTHLSSADFQRICRTVEDLGFDALVVPEHLALPVDLEPNMGAYYPDALTAMAFIAGATSRLKVNSMVMVLPYHQPIRLAKAISTLDVLSGGRVMVTFGVGMAPAEFDTLGVPFEHRGRITEEYVAAMKTLWSSRYPTFAGEFVQFDHVVSEPRPIQQPHPPLWFGGRSLASLKRAARLGDGWAPAGGLLGKGPWLEEPEQLPGLLAEVRDMRQGGAGDRPFDVFLSVVQARIGPGHTPLPDTLAPKSADQLIHQIDRLARLGVTWTTVSRPQAAEDSLEAYLDNLRWVAHEILPSCQETTGSV